MAQDITQTGLPQNGQPCCNKTLSLRDLHGTGHQKLLLLPAGATAFAVATASAALTASAAALACGLCICGCESCGGKILLAVLLTVADPDLDAEASDLGV